VWGGGWKGSGTVPHVNDLCAEEGEGEQGGFAGDVKGRGVGEGSSDPGHLTYYRINSGGAPSRFSTF